MLGSVSGGENGGWYGQGRPGPGSLVKEGGIYPEGKEEPLKWFLKGSNL